MNVYDFDGRLRAADIKLPGMPVGRDDDHIYSVDYGADGRNSAPSTVAVHRVAMPR
jgi:hypothetical protein